MYICQDFTYCALAYYLDESRFPITPVIKRGSRASEFAGLQPRQPLRYERWLERLPADDEAWIVLSHLGAGEKALTFYQVLGDLRELGRAQTYPIRGNVVVVHWQRQIEGRSPTPRDPG